MRRVLVRIILCLILGAVTTVVVAWAFALFPPRMQAVEPPYDDFGAAFFYVDCRESQVWGLACVATGIGASGFDFRLWHEDFPGEFVQEWREARHKFPEAWIDPPPWSASRNESWLQEVDAPYRVLADRLWGWPFRSMSYAMQIARGRLTPVPIPRVDAAPDLVTADKNRPRLGQWELVDVAWGVNIGDRIIGQQQNKPTIGVVIGYMIHTDLNFRILPLRPLFPGFAINTLFYGAIWFVLFFGFSALRRTIRRRRGRCPRCAYDLRGQRAERHPERGGTLIGCPECGWNRAADDSSGDDARG